ncbi:MAG: acetate--CoA ligase [Syntrophothermus sp.]
MPISEIIGKKAPEANLADYEETCRSFDWEEVRKELTFFDDGKVNIAYDAIDRHCQTWRKDKVALIWEGEDGRQKKFTFLDVKQATDKIANLLKGRGVQKGDRVFLFLPRIPELYFSVIAVAKLGGIVGPLFSAFGPEGVRDRLSDGEAKILITTPELKKRLEGIRKDLPALEHILLVGGQRAEGREQLGPGEVSFEKEFDKAPELFQIEHMDPEDPLYILHTSGTTGRPKGVVHVHNDMISYYITSKFVLDLRDEDVYWCTADPGWVTGTVYGIFGPWLNGATQVVYEGRFDPDRWYALIEKNKVTVWYTAPTPLRLLMKAGDELAKRYNLKSLRHILSVGEPLHPEVIRWAMQFYGLPVHDTWWQTETGSMMIANYPSMPIKLGSMGKPLPGITAAIIDIEGNELPPEQTGFLALKPGWPSMLRQIWRNPARYGEYFRAGGWYLTGDTAYRDADGYFWFVGRADDVINTSGHRVGPYEVESVLVEHPAVAEAGVIGKPDPERGQIIKAFVALRNGFYPSEQLKEEMRDFVRERLATHAYPREIEFRDSLPKTRSGKIIRRVLKAWDLGLPPGDLSIVE